MKKIYFSFLLVFIAFFQLANAEPIDSTTARQLAQRFYQQKAHISIDQRETPQIVQCAKADITIAGTRNTVSRDCYYVVNFTNGFVIISADDRVEPILAYSTTSTFNTQNIPDNVMYWMDGYRQTIAEMISNDRSSSEEVSLHWYNLKHNIIENSRNAVGPLVQTTWNQEPYYNNYCPVDADNTYSGHAVTGCVATAMAQIIRYWEYPTTGSGYHSYTTYGNPEQGYGDYGTLSVNYSEAHYDYSLMPPSLSSSSSAAQIDAVAKLMYHCGVSVNMNYGPSGSGAAYAYVPNALMTYFVYPTGIQCIYKEDYTDVAWKNLIKNELDNLRPLIYGGTNSYGSGHAFICDGYDGDYFHINWGWGGSSDGNFLLSPGPGNFNNNQHLIYGISAASSFIRCGSNTLSLSSPVGGVGEIQTVEVRGHMLSGNINVTVNGNFIVGNNAGTLSTSTTLPADGGTLYVQYQPLSSTPQTEEGYAVISSGSLHDTILLFGESYLTMCFAPTNLTATVNATNVNLNWTAPIQNTIPESSTISWDSTIYTYFSMGSNLTYCMLQRYKVSDLSSFNQHYLNAISFIPRSGTTHCRIVAYQGGSCSDCTDGYNCTFTPGEQIVNQEVPLSALNFNNWNSVNLLNPFIIDNTKELWFGIIIYSESGYPVCLGSSTYMDHQGGIIANYSGSYDESANFSFYEMSDLTSGGTHPWARNILLKANIEKVTSQVDHYEVYKNDTHLGNTTNTSYTDNHVLTNPCRYTVYAVNDNYCTSEASILAYPTIPCLPSVVTGDMTQTSNTTATCSGTVIHNGNSSITGRGFCWSTSHNPTISDEHLAVGSGMGDFSGTLTGLIPGSTYYVRAYVTNSIGTNYGEEQSITLYFVVPQTGTETYTVNNDIVKVYDHAGPRNNYSRNCSGSLTLHTGDPNQTFEITGSYNLTYYYYYGGDPIDVLSIYDGSSTSGTLLFQGTFTGSISTPVTSTQSSITIYFSAPNVSIPTDVSGFNLNIRKIGEPSSATNPTVTTSEVSSIAATTATCGGNVTADGGASVTARGVCWSTSPNPTMSGNHSTDGSGTGSFTSNITGLTPNTTYYVRAYATNSVGTSYGEQKTFTTSCDVVAIGISASTVISGGTTTIDYGQNTTLSASGANSYVWKTGSTTVGNTASVTVNPTSATTYTVTGTNSYGCTGTASVTVAVNYLAPTVTTSNVTGIAATTATCGGNVTADGGASVTARGVCWSTSPNPTVSGSHNTNGSGTGSFTSNITGLTPNTTYYVRAYATNSVGTSYGEQKTFTTSCDVVAISISASTVISGGTTTINYGQSTTLSASGANSYVWKTGSITVGNTASVSVNPTSATTYTVTGTNSYGCTGTASVTVAVNYLAPTVTTSNVTGIAATTATCGGNVTADGGASVTARGVCWSTSPNPTVSSNHSTDGSGTGSFTSNITGLTPNTTYYVRAYATNSVGTSYGEQKTFTTSCDVVAISISASTVISGGTTTINYGQSTTLSASGANSYVWKTGSTTVGTTASITVNPTSTTTYTVTGTNSYGCTGTASVTVAVNTTFTLTILYQYSNGANAAPSYTETIDYGTYYSIPSPSITGYTASQTSVSGYMGAENVTIMVNYTLNSYTITYMDGNTVLDIDTFAYGAVVTPIDNPTMTGYTFNGWSESLPTTMPAQDITVYAQWSVNSYTITYMDGNTVLDVDTFAYGTIVTPIDNPTMTGYTFNGWSESLPTTMPAQDITVYAQWSVNSYTITYMDGNTVLDIDTFAYGTIVTPIDNPSLTGYTFNGWSEELPTTMPANDITVYAQWNVNSYTITYMDGNTVLDIDTFAYDAVVTPIDNPTLTGYTFTGWSEALPSTMPANDITVHAQWSVNLYTITYMDGNTVLDIDTFAYGAVVTPIDNPTMTGYTFNGWSEELPTTMPAHNIVVYAQWSGRTFTITYMDGNTVLDIDSFAYGAIVTPIDNPTMTGYTFNGWSEELPNTMPANDITVYAQWSINAYTITYMDGNTVLDVDTFTYGAIVTPIDDPTMTGYTFNGWSEALPNTMPAHDIVVYAQWSGRTFTITYMDGNTVLDIDTFAYGAVVTPIDNPTLTGYTFTGWSETLPSTMPANNITVYAQWSVNSYTITYMDGNTVLDVDTFTYGAVVTPIDNPTMTGYTFNGWSEELPNTMPANDITVHAQWSVNTYTITYMDGNTVLDIDSFAYGAVVTPIDNPTMTGYTFNGWSEALPNTMPAHDIVVYAQWSGRTFTITYMDGNTVLDIDTFAYGAIVTPIDNPTLTGYTFNGWSEELPTTMPANDITVYAQWSVNSYTITYMDGNTVLDIDTFAYGAVVTPSDNPTMTGYTFNGWSETLPATMPANDITVYALWSVNSYTITYMDGNTLLDVDTFDYGAVITPIDEPTLTGYTFNGWSEELPTTMPANDITVHAQWSVNFYTITYMDGNTVLDVDTFAYGADITPIDNPTMTGYTFSGWSEELPTTMPANDITVYAQWSINSYTITYMDGNTVLDIDTFAYGAVVTPIDDPTMTGYTFNGWSEELPTTMPANDITVYAQWSINSYTITYMDGNTVLDIDTFAYGAAVSPIDDPTMTGYTFTGWSESLPTTMPAQDITVYAQWSVNSYTITYMDGNTVLDIDTFAYGAIVTPIDNPSMTGYTFSGWSEELPTTMPANNITVYAQWSVNSYTITYMDGNTVLDIDTFAYGAVVTPIDNPTLTGYTFTGWSEALPSTMPANNITVYAQWSVNSYTITYMDGNTVLDIDTFAYGADITPIDNPTMTGYTFNGWSEPLPSTMPANDITVYAQWSTNTYTITYMDGNTVLDVDTFAYGAVVTPIDDPTMAGYTFNGWSEQLPMTMPTNDIEVYAQWSVNSYTITYMDGNTVLDIDTFAYGAVVTPIDNPTMTGYTFNGWSEELPTTMPANDITVYAQWSINTYTITYMDGNTVLDIDTFAYSAVVTPIDNPTMTGYTFIGWSETLPATMPANDIVVYAQWSVNSYTITYMDGNTVLNIDSFAYGAVVTPIDNPTMTGYTFNGWSEELPATMPANDIVVYAQWSVNTYTITYMDGNTVLDIDTFAYGAMVTPIDNPTMTGYTFNGWSEELPATMPANDITVYAQWSINSYTITYMDGNTVLNIDTFAYDAVVTPIDDPTLTGYTFNGWSESLPSTMPANDITVHAQWSVNSYTITYMDGNTVLDIDTFAYDAVVTPIDNPTMTGYTFNGWSEELPATMPANDITVYAQWSVNSYTITYMDGNTVLDIDTFTYGAVVTPIDNPTMTGYTFNGWSEELPATMPANDITVYAQWSINTYTISYMDGNTVLDIDTFAYGAVVTPIDDPTLTGYTFNGWSETLPNTMPANNITVYAQWSVNSYTITYMDGNTALDIDTFAYGAVVTPIDNPTMIGYTFNGWSEQLPSTMPANDITVYAQWSINSYTITYMDGNTVLDVDTFAYGAIVTPIDNPSLTGYTFNGWSESLPNTMPAHDIVVYAQWSGRTFTITYMDGNTVLDIDSFAYGAVVTPIDNPSMTGYTFNGWSESLPTTMPANDIVVYAQWSVNSYTITYMDGNTVLDIDTFAYDAVVTPIDNPTLTGYTFTGWSEELPTTMPANDITVYAQWSINSYTIIYMDGNTVLDIDTFAYGAVVTPIDNPTMTGYTFNGWSESLPNTMPANDIVVYAQWSVNTYTITYMDGNTVLDIDTFAYGSVVTPIDNPSMTGYTFSGWNEPLPATMPANDITVYAQWSVNSYTITYMDGNTVLNIDTFAYGAVVTPIDNPTMTGYTFDGWSEELPNTMPANDITVYAQWSVNSYTITYMDGNTVLDVDSFAYGAVVTPIDDPTMTGYTFNGWSEQLPTTMPANDITVYAQWSVNFYTITYMDGNTVLDVDSFAYGAVVTPIDDPTMTGYTFNGWSEQLPTTMPANDITVYAQWSVNSYTITYMDGNTVLDIDTFAYGAVVTPIDNPTLTGYTFNGWSEPLPSTMPANNITVYAQWVINNYTINVNVSNDTPWGTVTGYGSFAYGSTDTLTAIPNEHYLFAGWSDFNTDNPRIITVTQDSSFTAYFIPETFDINISSNDETMGTVNVNIDGPVAFNTAIIITAIPAPHYHFVSWSDGNTDNPRTIYVTQALNLTAIFAIDQHVITVLSNDDNMGTVIGGGTYDYGSEILLRAEALEGYEFVSWNDGNTDNPRTITVEQDSSFTAIFHLLDNINDMLLSQVSIYSYNDQIVISNAVGFSAQIFDMTGRLIVNEAVISQSRRQYSISTDGIYLVKVGDSLFKKVIITK